MMMHCLYNLFIRLYSWGIAIASLWNEKAKLLHSGRKKTFATLQTECAGKKVVWLHAASLGEYEQGKPLIQQLRAMHPEYTFLVTFFSPSGYEVKKNDPDIDILAYLPADTPRNAKRLVKTVNPVSAYFVKYEFWYNFMIALNANNIPFYFFSAIFRPSQYFFKPYGKWFARQLRLVTHFFVQNTTSRDLLNKIGVHCVTIAGDTRFDRVSAIAQANEDLPFVELFKGTGKLLVAGSTWMPDEKLLLDVYRDVKKYGYHLLIAPHVIDNEHIQQILTLFSSEKTILYSDYKCQNLAEYDVMIINSIGLLSRIYKYADVAYIGGAFETGLHNTLEAAVFGIPLFFGPKHSKFDEAVHLVQREGAFSVLSAHDMIKKLRQFEENQTFYDHTCAICQSYVQENLGACRKILAVTEPI